MNQILWHDDPTSGAFSPADVDFKKTPDFGDRVLLAAIQQFIVFFGQKYNGDQRIAFLQLGMAGGLLG